MRLLRRAGVAVAIAAATLLAPTSPAHASGSCTPGNWCLYGPSAGSGMVATSSGNWQGWVHAGFVDNAGIHDGSYDHVRVDYYNQRTGYYFTSCLHYEGDPDGGASYEWLPDNLNTIVYKMTWRPGPNC